MVALLTAAQYQARTNSTLDAGQTTQVEALIDDASAEVLLVGDPDWDPDDVDNPVPGAVVSVVFRMVSRAFANPHGFRSETIGDYSYSRGSAMSDADGIHMTADEYRTVRRAAGRSNVVGVGTRRDLPYERDWLRGAL